MCTSIFDKGLFGRTLDLECSYGEVVAITPKGYCFSYLYEKDSGNNDIIGIAHIENGVPLYYDAMNEKGLCIAGLNFPKYAVYQPRVEGKINIASFELIPYILRNCDSADKAIELLDNINITNDSFSSKLSATPLHWMIADKCGSYVVEATTYGLKIHKNDFGVMTNSPDFDFHKINASNYMMLDSKSPKNTLCPCVNLESYSRGLGAFGLPGDFSSVSRFIRALYVKSHTCVDKNRINRFFRIMDSVSVPLGCIITDTDEAVYTVYASCMDMSSCDLYYSTYENRELRKVGLYDYCSNDNKIIEIKM